MSKLNRKQVVGIKQETPAQNTLMTLIASDYLVAQNIDVNINPEVLNRDFRRASMSNLDHVIGKRFVSVKFTTELKASGAAGTAYAPLGAAIQATQWVETVTATQTVGFVSVTNGGSGYTSAPAVTFTGGVGTGAAAIASIDSAGKVQGVIMTNAGTGYTSAPTVAFVGGGGAAAAATATVTGSVTYGPTSVTAANYFGPGKSVTISVNKDGIFHSIIGCVGKMKMGWNSGKFVPIDFEFNGIYSNPTDTAAPATTYITQTPAKWENSYVSLQGFAPVIDKFEIDWATTISPRDDAKAATSLLGFILTDRDPKGSCEVEMEPVAVHDFYGKLMASTSAPFGVTLGAVAGNIIHISMPKIQYNDVQYGDRGGIMVANVPFAINGNTGDDEAVIIMA